ncbi:hypothetical protein ACRCKP_04885 [Acinetobacter baumannii]|uniref:hypothetical protein n=2 Tax=Acinetobacter baumannii TaxID=470 RepID=UPI003D6C66AB
MMSTPTSEDIHEDILLNMLDLKHRLSLMSKVQVINGEQLNHEELSALFSSFSKDMIDIIKRYESMI